MFNIILLFLLDIFLPSEATITIKGEERNRKKDFFFSLFCFITSIISLTIFNNVMLSLFVYLLVNSFTDYFSLKGNRWVIRYVTIYVILNLPLYIYSYYLLVVLFLLMIAYNISMADNRGFLLNFIVGSFFSWKYGVLETIFLLLMFSVFHNKKKKTPILQIIVFLAFLKILWI